MPQLGTNSRLYRGTTEIEGLTSLTPSEEIGEVEITQLTSVAKEYMSALLDANLNGECFYSETTYNQLNGYRGLTLTYKLVFPDGLEADFSGILMSLEAELNAEDVAKIKFVLKVTGDFEVTENFSLAPGSGGLVMGGGGTTP